MIEKISKVATNFYKELDQGKRKDYSLAVRNRHKMEEHGVECSEAGAEPLLKEEVAQVIINLKCNKAPGPDNRRE